jgi:uncharacterized membrane protein (DUF373 family)
MMAGRASFISAVPVLALVLAALGFAIYCEVGLLHADSALPAQVAVGRRPCRVDLARRHRVPDPRKATLIRRQHCGRLTQTGRRTGMLPRAEDGRRDGGTMTGMPPFPGEDPARPAAVPAESSPADGSSRRQSVPAATRSIWVLEHVQDWVTVAVGVVLIALAVVLLVAGIVDFLDGSSGPISAGAPVLLDRVLLVLILVEIVYTVVLSLRAHRLVAQPFIVVGLIAVVRRILFVLTPGSTAISTAELALLIAMVAVFIAGLVVVSHFEKGDD